MPSEPLSSDSEQEAPSTEHGFLVSKARKADMPAIFEMISLLFPNSRNRHLPGDRYLVAKRAGVPIGFCHYRIRAKLCCIAGLGVLAQYRERGAGSHLMAEALFDADRKGVQTTYLKVRALNSAAKLYLQFGFYEKRMGETLLLVRKRPS